MAKLEVEACSDWCCVPAPTCRKMPHMPRCWIARNRFRREWKIRGATPFLLTLPDWNHFLVRLPKIARDLARRASDLGLESNVAVAANPDTAVIAARGFSGVTVIPDGKEAEQLGSLPVEVLLRGEHDLQETEQFLETFRRWGIRKLRDLATLPDVALSERLGQQAAFAKAGSWRHFPHVDSG